MFDGYGDIHNHCNYNWAVDCGKRVYDDTPISSPGCLYQFGIYPVGEGCQTTFFKVRMSEVTRCNCQNLLHTFIMVEKMKKRLECSGRSSCSYRAVNVNITFS